MIWFHIPLKSHWQMPLVSSPMAGCQTPSLHPLHPPLRSDQASAAACTADLLSCLFTCLCVGKRRCFHWWLLPKPLEAEDLPRGLTVLFPPPSPPPPHCQKPTDFQTWLSEKECSLIGIPGSRKQGSSSFVLLPSVKNFPGIHIIQVSFLDFFSLKFKEKRGKYLGAWQIFFVAQHLSFNIQIQFYPQWPWMHQKWNGKPCVKSCISLLANESGPIEKATVTLPAWQYSEGQLFSPWLFCGRKSSLTGIVKTLDFNCPIFYTADSWRRGCKKHIHVPDKSFRGLSCKLSRGLGEKVGMYYSPPHPHNPSHIRKTKNWGNGNKEKNTLSQTRSDRN